MSMNGPNRRRSSSNATPRRRTNAPLSGARGHMHFDIPSDFTEGRKVQKAILDAVARFGFDPDNVFAIKLALEEAMINAIRHGNKLDRDKKVHVDAIINEHEARITIEDEGIGFNRATVPDPTSEENLTKCSGRGLLLMETYMTSEEYSNKGRRIHMVKKREPVKV